MSLAEKKPGSSRIVELDLLRGFAALNVVAFHYTDRFRAQFGHTYPQKYDWPYGYYGVHLFFIISGFVIFLTLQKVTSTRDFFYKRFTRLYPTYWICLLLTFSVVSIAGLPGKEVTIKEALLNLTMAPSLFHAKKIDGAYWSLLPELLFYLMMGTLFRFNLLKRIRIIGVIWLILTLIPKVFTVPEMVSFLLNLKYGMLFFAGILFYRIKFGKHDIWDHVLIIACCLTAIINDYSHIAVVIFASIFAVFYLFVYNKLAWLAVKPLIFIGAVSYPLYLIHQNVGFIMIRSLKTFIPNEFMILVLVVLFMILFAWIITAYIEQPIMKALRKKSKKRGSLPDTLTSIL